MRTVVRNHRNSFFDLRPEVVHIPGRVHCEVDCNPCLSHSRKSAGPFYITCKLKATGIPFPYVRCIYMRDQVSLALRDPSLWLNLYLTGESAAAESLHGLQCPSRNDRHDTQDVWYSVKKRSRLHAVFTFILLPFARTQPAAGPDEVLMII